MNSQLAVFILVVLGGMWRLAAQQREAGPDDLVQRHINAMAEELRVDPRTTEGQQRFSQNQPRVVATLNETIDTFVTEAFDGHADPSSVQGRLRQVLEAIPPHPEMGELPVVRSTSVGGHRALVVGYSFFGKGTLRAYRLSSGRPLLIATAGDDFDGHGFFTHELPSILPSELWLLVWGKSGTFNGTKVRFRILAFDGEAFRTVWSPDDLYEATLKMTADGFSIDHHRREPPFDFHNRYRLTPEGPVQVVGQ